MMLYLLGTALGQMSVTVLGEAEDPGTDEEFLRVSMIVENTQTSLAAALHENSQIIDKVRDILKKAGIKPSSLDVSKPAITPVYELDRKENVFNGLVVSQSLSFDAKEDHLRDGLLIDDIVEAGVTQVESIDWAEDENKEQQHRSSPYLEALEDARGKAEALCRQVGHTVKTLEEIEEVPLQAEEEEEEETPLEEAGVTRLKVTFGCGAAKKKKEKEGEL